MPFQKVAAYCGLTIAERGLQYFNLGKVQQLEQNKQSWYAEIAGTFPYFARISLNKNQNISSYECTCPYDGRCKHIAALYFAVLNEIGYQSKPEEKSHHFNNDDEATLQDLRDCFNRCSKGCDYWEVQRTAESFEYFLSSERMCENEEIEFKLLHTFYIRMNTLIQKSDDDGVFAGMIDECVELQQKLYRETENQKLKRKIENAWFKIISDSDKHWIALETTPMPDYWLKAICQTGKAEKALEWLNKHIDATEYGIEEWLLQKYKVLFYIDEQQAVEFVLKNVKYPKLRQVAVDYYVQKNDISQAKILLLEGISLENNKYSALGWKKQLLNLSYNSLSIKEIQNTYFELMLYEQPNQINTEAFKKWKESFNEQEFTNAIEKALESRELKSQTNKQAHFLILINRLDLLKTLLLNEIYIPIISSFISHLERESQLRVALHWLDLLCKDIGNNRQGYQKWVKNINNFIKKYPELNSEIKQRVQDIQTQYNNRRALIDEMRKIKGL